MKVNDSNEDFLVNNFEGQPVSPIEMGIKETDLGGGEQVSSDLKTELKKTFNPAFSTLGHGTSPEAAKSILKNGLRANNNHLDMTTVPLFDGSKPYEEQSDEVIEKIQHWPHRGHKAVVVVMIPNPKDGEIGGNDYYNSVFQDLDKTSGYKTYLIPREYIKGYIDVETGKFVSNPDFKPGELKVKVINNLTPNPGLNPEDVQSVTVGKSDTGEVW